MEYVSFYSLLYYSNSDMGSTRMSLSEYMYAVQLYSSSEQYAQYLYSLLYNTTVYNYADLSICSVVEYVTADIIPNNYYLTGHGEPSTDSLTSAFYEWGLPSLDTTKEEIPEDAASILINMPSEDITESERDILLEYLEGGGQLTFVTNEKNLDMPNLCAILEAYGMAVENKAFVNEPLGEGEDERETTQIYPNVDFKNEIFGSISSTASIEPVVKNANAISMNENAKGDLLIYPLLTTSDGAYLGDNAEAKASYTVACAAETGDGARVVWFTGGESYNEAASIGANLVAYGLTWVTLEYTSAVSELPPALYAQPTTIVSSGGATLITVLLCLIAIGVAVYGVTVIYKRKKLK
jgi:ABC-2 type transport system permease protein